PELERRLLVAGDGPPVHDLKLPDRTDRPLFEPFEGLGDESSREREGRKAECDDGPEQHRPPPLAGQVAQGDREGAHRSSASGVPRAPSRSTSSSDSTCPSWSAITRRARPTTRGSCVAKRKATPLESQIPRIRSRISSAVLESRFAVGSSAKTTDG